jgi:hypothetical protein
VSITPVVIMVASAAAIARLVFMDESLYSLN